MPTVFFDVDGTLVELSTGYGDLLSETFHAEVGACEQAWLDYYNDRFFAYFTDLVDDPYRRAFADVADRFDLACDPAAVADAHVTREIEAVEVRPAVETVVDRLADRVELGVLTNGLPAVQREKLAAHGLADRFDVTVASHDRAVGALKPDGDIFAAAKRRATSDEYVMLGDDYEADVEGARRHGFDAVHVDGNAPALVPSDVPALATPLDEE